MSHWHGLLRTLPDRCVCGVTIGKDDPLGGIWVTKEPDEIRQELLAGSDDSIERFKELMAEAGYYKVGDPAV